MSAERLSPTRKTQPRIVVALQRLVRRWRDARYKLRCEWRLYWNLCPNCNSDAPRCDRCGTCHGSREFPLKPETKERYRHSFNNDYDRA
jgi:hypothetical protein